MKNRQLLSLRYRTTALLILLTIGHCANAASYRYQKPFITVAELQQLINTGNVKVIDSVISGNVPVPDSKVYLSSYYGKFDLLMQIFQDTEYTNKHIPNAIPLNLNIACYPGLFQRYELYPPNIFERLLRKLGINDSDRIVVYDRNSLGGMLHAARIWLILKYYGVKNVQILYGGLEAWERSGNAVTNARTPFESGNFKATTNPEFIITFEELEARNADGEALIDSFETINVYDVRSADQYSGRTHVAYPASEILRGSHIKGAKNLPLISMFNQTYGLKKASLLIDALNRAGYLPGKPIILYCNSGNQAALMMVILYSTGIENLKIYQGGMTEMALRDPERIA